VRDSVFVVISDIHAGSLLGLTPRDEIRPLVRATQEPLIDWYEKQREEIGRVDGVIGNGDMVEGPGSKRALGLLTTDTDEQADLAIRLLEPWKAKRYFFTFGTPYHVTGSEDWEKGIAKHFNAPIKDMLYLDIAGHLCRFRHHVGRSDIPYGQGTPLFREAVRDTLYAIDEEEDPAEFLFHGHVHYYFRAENARQTAIAGPCLQTPESVYGRVCRSSYYDIGLLVIRANKERLIVEKRIMPIKYVRKREYIKA